MENLQELTTSAFGIILSEKQLAMFSLFEELLLKWNKKYNLTAITDPKEITIKHFYDSLSCFSILPENESFSLIDIGTGAGFPGIPLKIANPLISLTLAESIRKKADFCQIAINELGLESTRVDPSRAETIGQDISHREKYDWAVARAVAPLPTLVEYLLPLVKVGGKVITQKGGEINKELEQSKNAIRILGGKLVSVIPISLPHDMGERTLVHIKKIRATPASYPRKPGKPKKKPLL